MQNYSYNHRKFDSEKKLSWIVMGFDLFGNVTTSLNGSLDLFKRRLKPSHELYKRKQLIIKTIPSISSSHRLKTLYLT